MERLSLENIETYIVLNNELAFEEPYILKISKSDFLEHKMGKIESGCIDIFILYNDKEGIGFIELNKESGTAIIEKIFIRKQHRTYSTYKSMLESVHKYYYSTDIRAVKYIGLNNRIDLLEVLKEIGYIMEKEHIQMERAIINLSERNFSVNNKTFFNIEDKKWLYKFVEKCMENSIFNYKEEEINELAHMENDLTFVLYENNQPIGFIIAYINEKRNKQENKRVIYIEEIGILKEFRNKGYGCKIIEFIMEKGRNLGMDIARLHVYRHNEIAYGLYKKLGFKEIKSIGHWVKILNE